MTDLNEFARIEPIDAHDELRLPVAYSHGGFAQLRHAVVNSDADPLGPIPVPADFEASLAKEFNGRSELESAVLFLRR